MPFPDHIFKAYDIRGVYPRELNEDLMYRIGRAFVEFMKRDVGKETLTLAVARDMRASSLPLLAAVTRGMAEQGADVVDIGLASSPTFYFGVGFYGFDGGLHVTASHNPGEYNGCKMVRPRAVPISGDTGIMDIRDMVKTGAFPAVDRKGSVEKKEGALADHVAYALSTADATRIKPLHVVIDTANGMGAPLMDELFKRLPCQLTRMYWELDGAFPNHEANPLKDENNRDLQKKIVEVGADLGIGFDGDADRVFFVDEKGETIHPAILRGILARIFLREHPGAKICYDIRPGRITVDMIEEAGGVPVVTRVGHSFIKEKMREEGAVFAGESSGHFFLNMPHGAFEAPEIMILKFLVELSESGKTASEYVRPLKRYFHSSELNFTVTNKQAVLDRLREQYGDHLKYDFDGLSFEWDNWWFNVRVSNTEDVVRLNLEARSEAVMKEKVEEIRSQILNPKS